MCFVCLCIINRLVKIYVNYCMSGFNISCIMIPIIFILYLGKKRVVYINLYKLIILIYDKVENFI